jgi:hypothetical protein
MRWPLFSQIVAKTARGMCSTSCAGNVIVNAGPASSRNSCDQFCWIREVWLQLNIHQQGIRPRLSPPQWSRAPANKQFSTKPSQRDWVHQKLTDSVSFADEIGARDVGAALCRAPARFLNMVLQKVFQK